MKKYKYRVVFEDDSAFGDWEFDLFTTEQKSYEEIESLIMYWVEVNDNNEEGYSPCDIMDDLVNNNPGWRWKDADDSIIITGWEPTN